MYLAGGFVLEYLCCVCLLGLVSASNAVCLEVRTSTLIHVPDHVKMSRTK